MKRVLTLFSCVVLFVVATLLPTSDMIAQTCAKPIAVGATSIADGKSAVAYATISPTSTINFPPATYEVQYKLASEANYAHDTIYKVNRVDSLAIILKNLTPCSKYQMRARTVCSSTLFSDWVNADFATLGCTTPTPVACAAATDFSATVAADTVVTFKWKKPNASAKIELGIFSTDGSFVKTYIVSDTTLIFKNLPKCQKFAARVRTQCDSTHFSEVSNYVNFATGGCVVTPPSCRKVEQIAFSTLDSASAIGKWSEGGNSGKYYVLYRPTTSASAPYKMDSTTQTTITLKGLTKCSVYEVRVVSVCNGKRDTSGATKFETACPLPPASCVAPTDFSVVVTSDTVVTFKWKKPNASAKIELGIFGTDGSFVKTYVVSDTSLVFKNLPKCQKFAARVRTQCDSTHFSGVSTYVNFATGGCVVTPPTCRKIEEVGFVAIDTASAIGKWSEGGNAGKYYVLYRPSTVSSATFKTDSTTLPYITLKGLAKCTPYEVRIVSVCNGVRDTSAPTKFQTLCVAPVVCTPPTGLTATVTTDSVVTFKFTITNTTSKYIVVVAAEDGSFKKEYPVTGSSLTIKDLKKCQKYAAAVVTQCDSVHTSLPSNYVQFTLTGCGTAPTACKKVEQVGFVGLDSTTAIGKWTPAGNGKYYVLYRPTTTPASAYKIDSTAETFITLKGLTKCTNYEVRIVSVCDAKRDTGETTKFATVCPINVTCAQPYAIVYTLTADTIANFSWRVKGIKSFVLQYQPTNSSSTAPWVSVNVQDTFTSIKGLQSCTVYTLRLRATCDSLRTDWLYYQFKTKGACPIPSGCVKPNEIQTKFVGDSTFVFWGYFSTTSNFPTFQVQYKLATDTAYKKDTLKATSVYTILRGLTNCKDYIVRVRTVCSATTFSDWVEYKFKAGNRCFTIGDPQSAVAKSANSIGNVAVSPNPSSTDPVVTFELTKTSNVSIKLVNMVGSAVISTNLGTLDAGTYYQTINNASNLNQGFYFISVQVEGEAQTTTRWMKL